MVVVVKEECGVSEWVDCGRKTKGRQCNRVKGDTSGWNFGLEVLGELSRCKGVLLGRFRECVDMYEEWQI